MKTQHTSITPAAQEQPKLQIIYSTKQELAAVHLITPQGIISYASLGTLPKPKGRSAKDAA